MNTCARPGCRRPVPLKKTRPSIYCSTACRVADFRRRKRIRAILSDMGFDDLVSQLRCAIVAQQEGQSDIRDAALNALAFHPLIAGKHATADTNGVMSSSQKNPARSRIGVPVALGAEGEL